MFGETTTVLKHKREIEGGGDGTIDIYRSIYLYMSMDGTRRRRRSGRRDRRRREGEACEQIEEASGVEVSGQAGGGGFLVSCRL